jgi:hypothetical protein
MRQMKLCLSRQLELPQPHTGGDMPSMLAFAPAQLPFGTASDGMLVAQRL